MKKIQKRKEIVNKIIVFANGYGEHLLGNTFMIIFDSRHIEISFSKKDFAHLTGVDKKLSAKDFYKEAKRGTLRENQIFFSKRHPYDLCIKKVAHMEQLVRAFNNDGIVIEKITTDTATYEFGFTDLNFTLCMGEDRDKEGVKKSEYFIPMSLRSGDCFDKGEEVYHIDYIYKKKNNQKLYEDKIYSSEQGVELNEAIRAMLK